MKWFACMVAVLFKSNLNFVFYQAVDRDKQAKKGKRGKSGKGKKSGKKVDCFSLFISAITDLFWPRSIHE